MTLDEMKIWAAIGASVLSIAVAVTSLLKSRKHKVKAIETAAVKEVAQETRNSNLETGVTALKGEINSVKSGLETGIGKVQDSLQGVVDGVNALQTKVAILINRDEREERASQAAQKAAAQFAAQRRLGPPSREYRWEFFLSTTKQLANEAHEKAAAGRGRRANARPWLGRLP